MALMHKNTHCCAYQSQRKCVHRSCRRGKKRGGGGVGVGYSGANVGEELWKKTSGGILCDHFGFGSETSDWVRSGWVCNQVQGHDPAARDKEEERTENAGALLFVSTMRPPHGRKDNQQRAQFRRAREGRSMDRWCLRSSEHSLVLVGDVREENPVDPRQSRSEASGYRTRLNHNFGSAALCNLASTWESKLGWRLPAGNQCSPGQMTAAR
ncbi:hypothetical protein NEUTE2DRAFT_124577 [Neurospora tetrasperma FGSC 2509]|nr:hypothetical protein NEUTE2DRAFT_124577 [Neurospora tetrasperma FGSC 2509]